MLPRRGRKRKRLDEHRYFATCARGLEPVLAEELRRLGASAIDPGRGGVAFAGPRVLVCHANLWLRTAIRVLMPILEAQVTSTDELYDAVQTLDWARFMTVAHTLAVDSNVRDSNITHSKYAALRVKDAICDQFVDKMGRRPSVDVERPMVGFNLHIAQNQATLSLDSSGDSLHKRGYRPILNRAPLNEALAAGLIYLTGWGGDGPFIDPMCGSGTLCIESAWMALNRPPGLTRKHFGFQGWMNYDVSLWAALRDEARRGVGRTLPHPIIGFDIRRDALAFCEENSRAAGIGHLLQFALRDVREFRPPDGPPGVILCNPPYGERLGEERELVPLYQALGDMIGRCPGWKVFIFTSNAFLTRCIRRKTARAVELFNGKLHCRLLEYQP